MTTTNDKATQDFNTVEFYLNRSYHHDAEQAAKRLRAEHAALNAVAEAAKRHLVVEKEKAKWLQNWLHNGEGKTLSEVSRASLGQLLAEMFQHTSGSKMPQALAALAAIRGGGK